MQAKDKTKMETDKPRQGDTAPVVQYVMRNIIFRTENTSVPKCGEPIYCPDSQEFLVGDGHTPVKDLKAIDNIVAASDGRLYTVSIDSHGRVTTVIPLEQFLSFQGQDMRLALSTYGFVNVSLN